MVRVHGKVGSRVHDAWTNVVQRCTNERDPLYRFYGARGIAVCERWRSFVNFYADMGDPPPRYTLERIDNNGPYAPENCKWATRAEQYRNRRSNVWLTHDGLTLTLSEWSKRLGIPARTISARLAKGWSTQGVLTPGKRSKWDNGRDL